MSYEEIWRRAADAKAAAAGRTPALDVDLPVERKTYMAPADCTPEAIAKSRDPFRGIDCVLAEPSEIPKK
jgi:hypothetical protein